MVSRSNFSSGDVHNIVVGELARCLTIIWSTFQIFVRVGGSAGRRFVCDVKAFYFRVYDPIRKTSSPVKNCTSRFDLKFSYIVTCTYHQKNVFCRGSVSLLCIDVGRYVVY